MKEERTAYQEKIDAQLEEWSAQIALLRAKAERARAEVRVDYYKTIETLQPKQDEARRKVHELKIASDEAWEGLKTGAEKAWDEVRAAIHSATSKLK